MIYVMPDWRRYMTDSKKAMGSFQLAIRWTARISSILIISVFLLMFFGEGLEPEKVKPLEWLMLLFGPFGLMLGMILGWWKEGLGGTIVVLSLTSALLVGAKRRRVGCNARLAWFIFADVP